MGNSRIEWTEKVWNPVTGCTKISPGCAHCYAERMANRLRGRCGYPADESFRVTLHPERLEEPLRWRKPRRVFVNSMGDLFHEDVLFEFIDQIVAVIALAQQHTFLILTKRPERMKQYLMVVKPENAAEDWRRQLYFASGRDRRLSDSCYFQWPLSNLWLGVTCENQQAADERVPILLQIPAAGRFVSVEPMLGPVDLKPYLRYRCAGCGDWLDPEEVQDQTHAVTAIDGNGEPYPEPCGPAYWQGINWVICGGETGPGARPMYPDWVRSLRNQCVATGVPFFFKQWGDATVWKSTADHLLPTALRLPKAKHGGRLLDGREWNEMPA